MNYDVLAGAPEIPDHRPELPPLDALGFEVHPRPTDGIVHYRKSRVDASGDALETIVRPNETTLVEITLTRVVHEETFRLDRTTKPRSFKKVDPGARIN